MIVYVDASAALKLVLREAETRAVEAFVGATRDTFASSWLLHTEMHCAAARQGYAGSARVASVLARIELTDLDRADLTAATGVPGRLRSADAIHLATALRIQADAMLVYDVELAAAAAAARTRRPRPALTAHVERDVSFWAFGADAARSEGLGPQPRDRPDLRTRGTGDVAGRGVGAPARRQCSVPGATRRRARAGRSRADAGRASSRAGATRAGVVPLRPSTSPTGGRCVVTGHHVRPVLQAAHIRPVGKDGVHRVDNGLLRSSRPDRVDVNAAGRGRLPPAVRSTRSA